MKSTVSALSTALFALVLCTPAIANDNYYYDRAGIYYWEDNDSSDLDGIAADIMIEGGEKQGFGIHAHLRAQYHRDAGYRYNQHSFAIGANYHLHDMAVFYLAPALSYVSDDGDREYDPAINLGWRGQFSRWAEAGVALRHDTNEHIDDTSLEVSARFWPFRKYGFHVGIQAYDEQDREYVFVGFTVRQD